MKKILVTGAAGFIGMHTTEALLARGDMVVGLDNLNAYYDPTLKEARLQRLKALPNAKGFRFIRAELSDAKAIAEVFDSDAFDGVIHLAAQAGVRYSLKNPQAYVDSNLTGFLNILEGVRHQLIGFFGSGIKTHGVIHPICFRKWQLLVAPINTGGAGIYEMPGAACLFIAKTLTLMADTLQDV